MKAQPKDLAGHKATVAPVTDSEVSRAKILLFLEHRSAAPRIHYLHSSPWVYVRETEDRQMIALFRELSEEGRVEAKRHITELHAAEEREKEAHRLLVREAFELSKRSLARYWGAEDDGEKPAEDI